MKTTIAICISLLVTTAQAADRRALTINDYLQLRRIAAVAVAPDGSRVAYVVSQPDPAKDKFESSMWLMNIDGSGSTQLGRGSNPEFSPDSKSLAFTAPDKNGNAQIFVRDLSSSDAPRQVTNGSLWPSVIHWSPDGKSIGFAGWIEQTKTWDVPLPPIPAGAKWTEGPHVVETLHYRTDGSGFVDTGTTHLFVVPSSGGEARQITHGSWSVGFWWDGLQNATWAWSPDSKTIVFDALTAPDADLHYEDCDINAVDVASGTLRKLTTKRGLWSAPAISPDGRWVAFNGFPAKNESYATQELYVVPLAGGELRKLSGSLDRDVAEINWTKDGLFFTAQDRGAQHIYRADLDGNVKRMTNGPNVFSLSGVANRLAVAIETSVAKPMEIVTIATDGGRTKQITHINDDFAQQFDFAPVEEAHFRSVDQTDIQGWLYKPATTPGRKYPLLLFIHGGPVVMGDTRFSFRAQYYAASGYYVLTINPRSASGYGTAFTNKVSYNMPGLDYEDLMRGVDWALEKYPSIDPKHLYVAGGSYGGTLTAWTIGHTMRFAAAVVESPNIDWISWTGNSDLPLSAANFFFRKPFWEDPKPWLEHSPLMYAGNVRTPTLIMNGEADYRTPIGQAEELYVALKTRGVKTRLLRFSADSHGGLPPSDVMRRLQYTLAWFREVEVGSDP